MARFSRLHTAFGFLHCQAQDYRAIYNRLIEMRDADIDQESFHDYGEYKGTSLANDIASFLRKASSAQDFVYVDLSHLCERLAEICGGRGPGDEYVEAIFTILHPYSDNSRRIEAGAHALEKNQKGRGLLIGGAPGVDPANVVILGGGVVGENAAIIATGMRLKKIHLYD